MRAHLYSRVQPEGAERVGKPSYAADFLAADFFLLRELFRLAGALRAEAFLPFRLADFRLAGDLRAEAFFAVFRFAVFRLADFFLAAAISPPYGVLCFRNGVRQQALVIRHERRRCL